MGISNDFMGLCIACWLNWSRIISVIGIRSSPRRVCVSDFRTGNRTVYAIFLDVRPRGPNSSRPGLWTPPAGQASVSPDEFVEKHLTTLRDAYELTREHLGSNASRRKRHYDLRTRPQEYSVGSWVWVYVPRRKGGRYQKWRSLYQGPFRIDRQFGPVNYLICWNDRSRPWTVHVDKLKPCHQPTDATPAHLAAPNHGLNPGNSDPMTAGRHRRNVRPPVRFRDD